MRIAGYKALLACCRTKKIRAGGEAPTLSRSTSRKGPMAHIRTIRPCSRRHSVTAHASPPGGRLGCLGFQRTKATGAARWEQGWGNASNACWHAKVLFRRPAPAADLCLCARGQAEAAELALADVPATLGVRLHYLAVISHGQRAQSAIERLQMDSCQEFGGYGTVGQPRNTADPAKRRFPATALVALMVFFRAPMWRFPSLEPSPSPRWVLTCICSPLSPLGRCVYACLRC